MTLESVIEAKACKEMERTGCICIKVGHNGWPDRLIVYAPTRVLWMEFKQPGGAIRKSQLIRKRELEAKGHPVHFVDSVKGAMGIVAKARRAIGHPTDGGKRTAAAAKNSAVVKARKRKNNHRPDGGQ